MLRRHSTQDVITEIVLTQEKPVKKPVSAQKLRRVAEIREELKVLRKQLAMFKKN